MARDDNGGRGKEMRGESAIYISTRDHIPLRLGQELDTPTKLSQAAMPVEQLTDRVVLRHPKVISARFAACMRSETGRRALPWRSSITVPP